MQPQAAKGVIIIDKGAASAVMNRKSLFAAGIVSIEGQFSTQDAVKILDLESNEIARGLVNYNSSDMKRILGKSSKDYEDTIGYHGPEEIIYRYNIVRTSQVSDKMVVALSLNDLTDLAEQQDSSD